jgi:titin
LLESLEDRVLLSVYAVINTNDSGEGSLRQAILDANAHLGSDTIIFDLPGSGAHTIRPNTPLPSITDTVVLDGTFQPGYAGSPLVELDGSLAGPNADGLIITAGNSVVRALAVNSFAGNGIVLRGQGGDVIAGNYVGTDITGTVARENNIGVFLDNTSDNTVGGNSPGAGNLVSGNNNAGVVLFSASGNRVQGNLIGTDVSGHARLGNRGGVYLQGGSNDLIGGDEAGAGNVISASILVGIDIMSGQSHWVQGNFVGTDITGNEPLGNGQDGMFVDGSNITIGGTAAGARNVVSANGHEGVYVTATSSGNVLQGNYVGTNAAGTAALANADAGVIINGTGATVGGTAPGAGNLLSGNHTYGLFMTGVYHVVQGNLVGTNANGTDAIPNGAGVGAQLASVITIGGTALGAGNLLSGNTTYGLWLIDTQASQIQGNLIGTDVTGTRALGNLVYGVFIQGPEHNVVGGVTPDARNVISGNGIGLELLAAQTAVEGNFIGTDVTGTAALGNDTGVSIEGRNNVVGGTDPGAGNLISGNRSSGILIDGTFVTGNVVQGNLIGTDVYGTTGLGNGGDGVLVSSASNNTIGETPDGAGNVIAYNGLDGVLVDTGTGNAFLQNSIFANGGLGIELLNHGSNDQPAPVLTSASSTGSLLTIQGTLTAAPLTTYTLEFFANTTADPSGFGQGERFIGFITVTTDANGNATFATGFASDVQPGEFLSATATDPDNNTSAFSQDVLITG